MRSFQRRHEHHSSLLTKLAALALLAISAPAARAQTPVQFGDTITEPGLYVLAGNQTGFGVGVTIASNDVTLLLLRFTLRGQGPQLGIASDGYDRVRIFGGRVTGFRFGISLADGEDCTVQGTRLDDNGDAGLLLRTVEESSFVRLTCDYNGGQGVLSINGYGNRFVSILAHHNDFDGIQINNLGIGVSNVVNKVRLCWAAYNGDNGIRILDAHDNEVTQNECVGNGLSGIRVEPFNPGVFGGNETQNNDVNRNWCVFNREGIFVGAGATRNTLHENIALANFAHDLVDENPGPPCANTWFLNTFLTKDGAGEDCIF